MEAVLKLKGKIEVIEPVVNFSYKWAINLGFSIYEASELALAVDELVTDVILHALKDEGAEFEVTFFNHPSFIEIVLKEFGEPFESSKHNYSAKKVLNHDNFKGAGFEIIKKMTDNFIFINNGKLGKEFRLVKNINHTHISQMKNLKIENSTLIENDINKFSFLPVAIEDAEDVAKLIYRTYSYTYPKEDLYYPERIIKYLETGKKFAVIARAENMLPCGYFAVIKHPNSKIGEVGEAVVSPDYRSKGIMTVMMNYLIDTAKNKKLEGLFGEAVALHTISQKVNAKFNFNSTAILLDLYPNVQQKGFKKTENKSPKGFTEQAHLTVSTFYTGNNDKNLRLSVVFDFLPLTERKEIKAYLPSKYKQILKYIFGNIGIKAIDKRVSGYFLKPHSSLKTDINYKYENTCILVEKYGEDFIDRISKKINSLMLKDIKVVYIDLPLDDPFTKVICEDLNKLGFIFSGLLPIYYKNRDFLRLQKISGKFNPKNLSLLSKTSKQIQKQIQRDLKCTTK